LIWFKEWDHILDWNPPFARWFAGGHLNASVNCLDRHINTDTKNKAAIIWESESGETRTLSYFQLYRQVNKFANVLKNLGVSKGDRVTIYMPMVPELPIAMLACARIGAIHSVVFSGFSAQALIDRANDAKSKVIVTADGGIRKGRLVELKKVVDESLLSLPSVEHVVVLKRAGNKVNTGPKDLWWHELMEDAKLYCPPEPVESTHPLYILYTSGTTGKPKGVMHGTGGYASLCYCQVGL
jgi:acetyl-CoA synthetase